MAQQKDILLNVFENEQEVKNVVVQQEAGKVLDELGVERYCCRAALLGHADMLPEITKFKKA